VPDALADDGRIVISGAVVEPTCVAGDASVAAVRALQSGAMGVARRVTCDSTADRPGSAYSRVVMALDSGMRAHDPLLDHYAAGVDAAAVEHAAPMLVVRTYE
jgi:hypothetical protein